MNHTIPHRSTVLVMHDDPLVRAGLVAALRQHPAFEVFVGDGDTVDSREPRVDGRHPPTTGWPCVSATWRSARGTDHSRRARIMALTSNDRETDIRRAIEAGIHGYLLLGGPLDELVEGVTSVAKGVRYLDDPWHNAWPTSLTHASLTSREIEVLRLVAIGESNKAIARQLNIELPTVKSHMTAIMTKLNATSRTQAAGIAATRGLVAERVFVRPVPLASRVDLVAPRMQLA